MGEIMSNLEHLLPELAKHCDKPSVELDVKKLKHLICNFDNAMLDMEPETALSSAVRLVNYLKEVLK
jgi:hypothetical protein